MSITTTVSQWKSLPGNLAGYFVISMPSISQTMYIGKAQDIKGRLRVYDKLLNGEKFDKFGVKVTIHTNPSPFMKDYLEANIGPHYAEELKLNAPSGAS